MRATSASRTRSSRERSSHASAMPAVAVNPPSRVIARTRWANSIAPSARAPGRITRTRRRRTRRRQPWPARGRGADSRDLVAADPVAAVGAAPSARDRRRRRLEALVAGLVPERVVAALQVVEVHEDEGDRLAAATGALQLAREVLLEGAVVAHPRERVGPRGLRGPGHLGPAGG